MKLAIVGLGKMGGNMTRRLIKRGHEVVAFDRSTEAVHEVSKEGAISSESLEDAVSKLSSPKVVWLMIPSGDPVEEAVKSLSKILDKGDIVIDGGNSNFHQTVLRAKFLKESGIHMLDAGTSGGVWGLEKGYCFMVGGEQKAFDIIEPALESLAAPDGYQRVGENGAGHYVKMIHNGIEYGLMQAYAEGFDLLEHSDFKLDLPRVAKLWNQGSVIRSWLLELSQDMLSANSKLDDVKGFVPDSGEGRWTVVESIDKSVPTPVITASLQARFRSRRENTFSDRFLASLRRQFGGHAVKKAS